MLITCTNFIRNLRFLVSDASKKYATCDLYSTLRRIPANCNLMGYWRVGKRSAENILLFVRVSASCMLRRLAGPDYPPLHPGLFFFSRPSGCFIESYKVSPRPIRPSPCSVIGRCTSLESQQAIPTTVTTSPVQTTKGTSLSRLNLVRPSAALPPCGS